MQYGVRGYQLLLEFALSLKRPKNSNRNKVPGRRPLRAVWRLPLLSLDHRQHRILFSVVQVQAADQVPRREFMSATIDQSACFF
jgi:hypothetical protein